MGRGVLAINHWGVKKLQQIVVDPFDTRTTFRGSEPSRTESVNKQTHALTNREWSNPTTACMTLINHVHVDVALCVPSHTRGGKALFPSSYAAGVGGWGVYMYCTQTEELEIEYGSGTHHRARWIPPPTVLCTHLQCYSYTERAPCCSYMYHHSRALLLGNSMRTMPPCI